MTRAPTETVSIDDVRDGFEELVNHVVRTGEPVAIERNGEPQVILVPASPPVGAGDALDRSRRSDVDNDSWGDLLDEAQALIAADLQGRPFPDPAEIIREMREERDAEFVQPFIDDLRRRKRDRSTGL